MVQVENFQVGDMVQLMVLHRDVSSDVSQERSSDFASTCSLVEPGSAAKRVDGANSNSTRGSFPCMLLLQILYQTWMISQESGYVVDIDTKAVQNFEFDAEKMTAYETCNSIWKMITSLDISHFPLR
ncbi:uncharacterized protein LOC133740313 isoform X2 [Rosa rugosa]|uniref:uncharacterized protein LOC133717676 isoform X2 n=1 Tax=Rosa rugosa TaxID=74645 RepID=UPI002B404333|nr:uncharacterized protein LOC133717676 isoform X2 [Rosa rugosa]XP_062024227.1 uncharacterized protein LOC133740313 isoform X2 [Rosa rugosa]